MRRSPAFLLLVLSLGLSLAACGQLPRPFEPGDKQANPLLLPPEGLELLVLQPTGLVPALPDGGAAYLARGLSMGGIKASAISRAATGADLRVHVSSRRLDADREELQIEWEVVSQEGAHRGSQNQEIVAPVGAWQKGTPWVLVAVAEVAADKLATLVAGPEQAVEVAAEAPQATAGPAVPTLAVGRIGGAPGDGDRSLGEALVLLLAQQGYRVQPADQAAVPGQVIVEGQVAVGAAEAGRQPISLTWIVLDAADGSELGRLEQKNQIQAGSLDGAWGETAVYAAMGAVDGINDILKRTGRR